VPLRLYNQQIAHTRLDTPDKSLPGWAGCKGRTTRFKMVIVWLPQATDADVERPLSERRMSAPGRWRHAALRRCSGRALDAGADIAENSQGPHAAATARTGRCTLARCRKLFTKALQVESSLPAMNSIPCWKARISTTAKRGYQSCGTPRSRRDLLCPPERQGADLRPAGGMGRVRSREKTRDEALAELALRYFTSRARHPAGLYLVVRPECGDARTGLMRSSRSCCNRP